MQTQKLARKKKSVIEVEKSDEHENIDSQTDLLFIVQDSRSLLLT